MMKGLEQKFHTVIGLLLWSLAGFITVAFYWELAGEDPARRVVMVLVALGLESAKILCWRSGIGWKRGLALLLVGLSIFASFSSALQVVQDLRAQDSAEVQASLARTDIYQSTLTEIASLDRQIEVGVRRLADLPVNFVTAAQRAQSALVELRSKRSAAADRLTHLAESAHGADSHQLSGVQVFGFLQSAFQVPQSVFVVAVLVVLATAVELGGLALAGRSEDYQSRGGIRPKRSVGLWHRQQIPQQEPSASQFRGKCGAPPTPEDYLRMARHLGQGGRPAGYRKVKQALGCSEPQARRLLSQLTASGQIAHMQRRQASRRQAEIR